MVKCENYYGCHRPRQTPHGFCRLCAYYIGAMRRYGYREYVKFTDLIHKAENGCWDWQGVTERGGYGIFRTPSGRIEVAHRASFEHYHRPIAPGMEIDHLCRRPGCVNPDHLEEVTRAENFARRSPRESAQSGGDD